MEKNWIKEIMEFIRKAMNNGLMINAHKYNCNEITYEFHINGEVRISIGSSNRIHLRTPRGYLNKPIEELSKRDYLELDAMMLSIEEYNEDMAVSEFDNFFKIEESKTPDIDDLNDDD